MITKPPQLEGLYSCKVHPELAMTDRQAHAHLLEKHPDIVRLAQQIEVIPIAGDAPPPRRRRRPVRRRR